MARLVGRSEHTLKRWKKQRVCEYAEFERLRVDLYTAEDIEQSRLIARLQRPCP